MKPGVEIDAVRYKALDRLWDRFKKAAKRRTEIAHYILPLMGASKNSCCIELVRVCCLTV